MTFTHALSTNNYGQSKFIVSASASNGTHTTIASALASASSGDTIFIRDGNYTENLTMVPGVQLIAYSQFTGLSSVTITGKMTFITPGSYSISNISLTTNSDYIVSCTGSNACNVYFENCELSGSNNTIIEFSNSNVSSNLQFSFCSLDLNTIGITYFIHSSPGQISFDDCALGNIGSSTTATTHTNGGAVFNYSTVAGAYSNSGSTAFFNASYSIFNTAAINITCVTIGSTGPQRDIQECTFRSGTASAISIGSGSSLAVIAGMVSSSNTNAITGSGTISYTGISFPSSSTVNTTTKIQLKFFPKSSPTIQTFTSGSSATYTTPANCQWIRIRLVGGGGGGGGSGTGSPVAGGSGGTTSFSTLSATGGSPGPISTTGGVAGGAGGIGSGGNIANFRGNPGETPLGNAPGILNGYGANGGASMFGGAAVGGANGGGTGNTATANSGSGGGGGGGTATEVGTAGGGGGGYVEHIINSPAATYTYTVGAGGSGVVAGTGGASGGSGGSGYIIVEEYYI